MRTHTGSALICLEKLFLAAIAVVVVAVPVVVWILNVPRLAAQSPVPGTGSPAFEVASVKPNKSGGERRVGPQPGRFTATNVTLRQLIQMAYSQRPFDRREILGGPSWIDSDHFDVVANVQGDMATLYLPDGKGAPGLAYLMLRTLLAERFKLAVHTEVRALPVYTLVTARPDNRMGPQLRRSEVDCTTVLAATADAIAKTGKPPAPIDPSKGPPCSFGPRPGHLSGNAVSMSQLADVLSPSVSRPVVDRTGLTGNFDLELDWTPDQAVATVDRGGTIIGAPTDFPSVFTALQEQLGLKLESTRGPVEVLVIDTVEQPTPN